MSATTAPRPFQVGDRVLVTRYDRTYSGVIERLGGPFGYIRRDDDPERSKMLELVALLEDLTAGQNRALGLIELWDGGINGVSTGVDEYQCPEPGCDYHVLAAGTPDPDEPDYYTEGIEEHERSHECRCAFDGEGQSVDAECPKHGDERTPIRDSGIVHDSASRADLATLRVSHPAPTPEPEPLPALVQLDQAHAEARLIQAALAWEASEHDVPWSHTDAQDELRAAAHDYRKATNR